MAWTTMHFAMGMVSAGALSGGACLILNRGWRWIPTAMTLGGLWALVPDLPRLFREDFPSLPFAAGLGSPTLENRLHGIGDLFFFHSRLDAQPHEYALHGLVIILVLYGLSSLCFAISPWIRRRHDRYRRRLRRENRHRVAHTYLYRNDLPEVEAEQDPRFAQTSESG